MSLNPEREHTFCMRRSWWNVEKPECFVLLIAMYVIPYNIICKIFTLNVFHITYNRWDQFMFRANNKTMIRQSNLIFHMNKLMSLFLCCCDTNCNFSFVTQRMIRNFFRPQNCSNFLQSSNARLCKFCRNMRWMFRILGFVKFGRCCVYMSHSFQYLRISYKQVGIKKWPHQIVAFVIQCFC